ncbi:ornithine cyclodeaminase family protein [Ruegeria pomeroyi]|nr:ornithine cyclodeaminase family protein [Ruegeria pomeroyi]NVK97573.1 ornithine cyclodeaminase family protein [Ruegeria pomeroyi]NVL00521.1 ornithine cyclodeaminase family protein [Ruegeria pomeroyi]QWV07853.1 ornithine cyclodeaminase family protein [Ruegeria pomeroyi]
MSDFLILSDPDLDTLGITTDEIQTALEAAIRAQIRATVHVAPKSALLPGDGRYVMTTLATGNSPALTVVKSVMVSPDNPARGLPGTEGVLLVQDSETGQLRALMQAGWITRMRTAGLSALVARRLGDPAARVVAFIGAGAQARAHLAALCDLFPLQRAVILGRGAENIARLSAAARARGLQAEIADNPHQAIADADLVVSSVTLDHQMTPFLDARWLKPGAFASLTDTGLPWQPDGMAALDPLYIDDLAQEAANPRPMIDPARVGGDLAALLGEDLHSTNVNRHDPSRRAGFLFRGPAIADFALAALALHRAQSLGAGRDTAWPDATRPGQSPA